MEKELASRGTAACRHILTAASLFYLLLPNLLFLLGWVQAYVALPVSFLLICATCWVCRYSKKDCCTPILSPPFSIFDGFCFFLTLAGLLLLTDLVGFHANIRQDPDFNYRNAIYATLVCEDWPVFSSCGDYFIYYHAFWLPPALLTKISGGWVAPQTALFWWSYTGLALSFSLFFIQLRKKIILFAAVLLGTFSLSYTVSLLYYIWDPGKEYYAFIDLNHFYLTNFCFNQLRCTFNHAVPGALFLAIVLCKGVPSRYLLLPAAYLFTLSPMAAVASIPLLTLILYHEWKANRKLPCNLPTFICCSLVLSVLIYLSGQDGTEGASLHFLWNDSPFWGLKSTQYAHAGFRIVHGFGLCISFLLPVFLLLSKSIRASLSFKALVITTVFITFVWIGRENNELLFKGSLVLAFLQATLLVRQWEAYSWPRTVSIILFIAISGIGFHSGYVLSTLRTYRRDKMEYNSNLVNKWNWSLEHPDDSHYPNFFGRNRVPWLLYNTPGEAKNILPAKHNDIKVFSENSFFTLFPSPTH